MERKNAVPQRAACGVGQRQDEGALSSAAWPLVSRETLDLTHAYGCLRNLSGLTDRWTHLGDGRRSGTTA